jgi:hypothetical protein
MTKTLSISQDSIVAMLKELPEDVLVDLFSKMLVQSDSSPLTDEELSSYKGALKEREKGETVRWHLGHLTRPI